MTPKMFPNFNLDILRDLTNRMWFSVVCTLIDNDMRHHSGQNLLWTHLAVPREYTTTMMTHTVVDKSTDNATPHSFWLNV